MSKIEKVIRSVLWRYLQEEISFSEFHQWFVTETWNIHKFGSEEDEKLVGSIELLIAEYTSNYMTKKELNKKLSAL